MNKEHGEQQFQTEQFVPNVPERVTIFRTYGLAVNVQKLPVTLELTEAGQTYSINEDTVVGEMTFSPFGLDPDTQKRSQILAAGLSGLTNIVHFFEQAKEENLPFSIPEYLIGTTNEQMARVAQRAGFHTEKLSGEVGYKVLGSLTEIRDRITQIQQRENGEFGKLLFNRATREDPELWNSLSSPERPQITIEDVYILPHEDMQQIFGDPERINRLRRKSTILKTTAIGAATGELGYGTEVFLHGNHINGSIIMAASLGLLGLEGVISFKSKKRNKNK